MVRVSVCAWLVLLAGFAAHAQPAIPFEAHTIDATRSGDCKAIGDLDWDGKGDVVLGGSSLSWYESGANFTRRIIRSTPVFGEFTTDTQVADIDADGDLDIVIGDADGPGNVMWFENPRWQAALGIPGDPRIGTNWIRHTIGSHGDTAHDIEVADLDADGLVEVVTSGHAFTRVWKRGAGETWAMRDLSDQAGAGVSLGDIDRDGRTDIATPRRWLRNQGDIIGTEWQEFPLNNTLDRDECLLVDLNADKKLDLLSCDAHGTQTVVWFEQPANATSPAWTRRTLDPSMGAHHPEAADFNRDGLTDLLLGLELSDVCIYINLGGGQFHKQVVADSGGHNARCGDLDGDTFPDILACDYIGNPPVTVYVNLTPDPEPCYANCDGSTAAPMLSANDLACFANAFAAGEPYANCDGSEGEATLTANDFQCFLNKFAAGDPAANCDGSMGMPILTPNDFQCFADRFAAGEAWANCDSSEPAQTLNANDFQCFLNRFAVGCP